MLLAQVAQIREHFALKRVAFLIQVLKCRPDEAASLVNSPGKRLANNTATRTGGLRWFTGKVFIDAKGSSGRHRLDCG